MFLWVDNTGLHSCLRAVNGQGHGDLDARGLLQVALQIITSHRLFVNGHETPGVADRTRSLRDILIASGLSESDLHITHVGDEDYWNACGRAAASAATSLDSSFVFHEAVSISVQPNVEVDARGIQPIMRLHEIVTGSLSAETRSEMAEQARGDGSLGAAIYMVCQDVLWRQVARMVSSTQSWTVGHSAALSAFVRVHLNDQLRLLSGVVDSNGIGINPEYSPAVGRARVLREDNLRILNKVSEEVDTVTQKLLDGVSLQVPSLLQGLLVRGKEQPRGVLESAIELREKSEPLRQWLATLVNKQSSSNIHEQYDVLKQIKAAGRQLHSCLDKQEPRSWGAIDISIWPLSLTFPLGAIKELREQRRARRNLAVLTELSKYAIVHCDESAYRRFVSKCCLRSGDNVQC